MDEEAQFPPIIELNVGGHMYTTTLLTLTKCPGNMLSAMFSGNYTAIKDKNGRFFIDADGENFLYILNYLRYGDLPPVSLAETVYREAAYFGMHGLIRELEKFPQILGKIQRSNFRSTFSQYGECFEDIITKASVETESKISDVKVLIYQKENEQEVEEFDQLHVCFPEGTDDSKIFADAKLGPWKGDCSEKDALNCIVFDLESQGFTVTSRFYAQCGYKCGTQVCQKSFYNVCFHWWKS